MSFDIPSLHIEPNSPEGQGLQAIIDRDHVTPEEAVRRILRDASATNRAASDLPDYAEIFAQAHTCPSAFKTPEEADRYIDRLRNEW